MKAKRRTPFCELRELFTKKYRGRELAIESSFHAIREKMRGEIAAIPVNGDVK